MNDFCLLALRCLVIIMIGKRKYKTPFVLKSSSCEGGSDWPTRQSIFGNPQEKYEGTSIPFPDHFMVSLPVIKKDKFQLRLLCLRAQVSSLSYSQVLKNVQTSFQKSCCPPAMPLPVCLEQLMCLH